MAALGITLTKRGKSDGDDIPDARAGTSVDGYLARLIGAGHRVAICDRSRTRRHRNSVVARARFVAR